jgi:hypothetical protein
VIQIPNFLGGTVELIKNVDCTNLMHSKTAESGLEWISCAFEAEESDEIL